jgi:hypothetical protein
MQQAMANDTSTDDSAEKILQMTDSAARASETQQQLQTQIQQMQQAMSLLQTQLSNQGYNPSSGQGYNQGYNPRGGQSSFGYQGRGRGRGRGQGRGSSYRPRNYAIYCWTHGGCGHTGATCLTKLAGHQDAATFTNKMGGSTRNCPT